MQPRAPFARCQDCPLQTEPFVPPYGPGLMGEVELIVVAEAPGQEEVKQGRPLIGPSGQMLDGCLKEINRDPAKIWRTNAVLCRPPLNRMPTDLEIECCNRRLQDEISRVNPSNLIPVVSLGKVPKLALTGGDPPRGAWTKAGDWNLMPTWHPAYVLRKPSEASSLIGDLRKAYHGTQSVFPFPSPATLQILLPHSVRELRECLSTIRADGPVSFDIETNNTFWYDRPAARANSVLELGITDRYDGGIIVDDEMLYDILGVKEVLNEFFARTDLEFVAQNGKFDVIFLKAQCGINARVDFDTILAHYVLHETGLHGLKGILAEEFDWPDYEQVLVKKYLSSKNDEYSKVPSASRQRYCILDIIGTLGLKEHVLEPSLKREGLYDQPFKSVIMKEHELAIGAEMRGVCIDMEYTRQASKMYEIRLEQLTQQMVSLCGHDFNPRSPYNVGDILYDQYKLPTPKQRGLRRLPPRSTSHEAIEKLAGHPFVDILMKYRRIDKLKGSYIDNMVEFAGLDNRVHASWAAYGTETSRWALKDPAMLTIPRPTDAKDYDKPTYDPFEDGATIRGCVVAGPGKVLIIADYSQAELRCTAAFSMDPFLLGVYRDGRDLHSEVALKMFGPSYTKEQRVRCKMFNFSWVYGGNEYSFAQDQGLSIVVAKAFVQEYNKVMARAVEWKKEQYALLKKQGYVETALGFRRRFPLITDLNKDEVMKAAVNAPIQGTVSNLTSLSAYEVDQTIPEAEVVLLVHDSIVAEATPENAPMVAEKMRTIMKTTAERYIPEVPWVVDIEVRERWVTPPNLSLRRVTSTSTAAIAA
jgi:uracil-DNA glycosylase family 4